ncbi:hypothetical protein ES703_118021 [subsurface metagenome]
MAYGDLGAVTDTLSYQAAASKCHEVVHVVDDIFAVSHRGFSWINLVQTFKVDALGEIPDTIEDEINHNGNVADDRNRLCKLTDSMYAIASTDPSYRLMIDTIQILANGQITDTVLGTFHQGAVYGMPGKLQKCGPGYLALSSDNYAHDLGQVRTFHVYADGTIDTTIVDTRDFESTACLEPFLAEIHPQIWAVAYKGPDDHGFIKTLSISPAGIIGAAALPSLEFDTAAVLYPTIAKAHGDYVAIGYTDSAGDGKLAIVEIDSGGAIGALVKDTYVFEAGEATRVSTYSIGQGYIGVAYSNVSAQGILKTFLVDGDGKLNDHTIDTLPFVATGAGHQHVIHATGDVWVVTHSGPGSTGQVDSFGLETPPEPGFTADLMRGMLR